MLFTGDNSFSNERCFIIGEVAQAHDGSLGTAHAFIDSIANTGADAVKFQTHIAAAESTRDEPWRVKFSYQDTTRCDYWKRMEFTEEQWRGLKKHAEERGLLFLSSPFSIEAVKLLSNINVPIWKVPSGEIGNIELLEAIWDTGLPILFSSGMSSIQELDFVVEKTRSRDIPFGIFQCTTVYPCSPKQWGIHMIDKLKDIFKCPVGFSDHSGNIYASLAAVALRADFIEVHVTFSRHMFGPDVCASVTPDELSIIVEGSKQIRESVDSSFDKDEMANSLSSTKRIFTRSWALRQDLSAGTVLCRKHLTLKKPGTGIPYFRYNDIIGKKLRCDKSSDYLLTWSDLG